MSFTKKNMKYWQDKKYLFLYFDSQMDPDMFDTNHDYITADRLKKAPLKLKFELIQSSVTEKFLSILNNYSERCYANGENLKFGYNYYGQRDANFILKAKVDLNRTISKINETGKLYIPENFLMNPEIFDSDNDKLNELHFIFESKKSNNYEGAEQINKLLWRVNNLVHVLQGVVGMDPVKFDSSWFMTSVLHTYEKIDLTKADYESFQILAPGLRVDYNTIGKDLLDCFHTNDLDLVRRKKVRQQLHVGGAMFLDFSNYSSNPSEFRENYDKWIADNRIGDFLDLQNPIYTPGRARLGNLVDPVIKDSKEWFKIWDKDYSFAGFSIE